LRTVRQWVGETAGGLPSGFWYLWANTLINRVGSFVVIVLAIYLTQERGFSETFAGLVIGLWGVGGAIGTLLGGVLADRWGRRPTFLTALYSSAAIMLLLGLARGPMEIAVTVVLLGLVNEAARPAMVALMIDIVPESDRLRAFSLNYWVINVGFAFAAMTAGLVAGVDYLLLFALNAATTVAGATLVAVKVREPVREPVHGRIGGTGRKAHGAAARRTAGPGLRAVFADRVFMAFVGANLLTALVFMQHISTLPMSMSRDGLSATTFGTVIALNGLLIVAGQLFVPRLLRGRESSRTLALSTLILGLGFGLTAFADAAWLYAVTVLVWTLGEMLNSPSNSATNAELSPADMRGRYQGVFSLSWSVAAFVAPIGGAAVLQYLGDAALWLGCFGIGILVAVIHLATGPARARRAAELSPTTVATESAPAGTQPTPGAPVAARPSEAVAALNSTTA
jgi:MFS family permease